VSLLFWRFVQYTCTYKPFFYSTVWRRCMLQFGFNDQWSTDLYYLTWRNYQSLVERLLWSRQGSNPVSFGL
jgi:hypothetical protein